MGNYLDFWLDKERGVSDYRCFMRDLNCVRLWNENCAEERESVRLTSRDWFTGSLVKKFRKWKLIVLVIEKSYECLPCLFPRDLGLVGELEYSQSSQARRFTFSQIHEQVGELSFQQEQVIRGRIF